MAKTYECPSCGANNCSVLETRKVSSNLRRRRKCGFCGKAFATIEIRIPETTQPAPGRDYSKFYAHLDETLKQFEEMETNEKSVA